MDTIENKSVDYETEEDNCIGIRKKRFMLLQLTTI